MIKKIFTLTLFLFLYSCGYEAIHSKKNSINYDFSISKINFIENGDVDINLKIKEKLNNYTLNEKDKKFILNIANKIDKKVIAKNKSGDPTTFRNTITINVEILMENNSKSKIKIIENFTYNNIDNKFELKKYEKEIRTNLAEAASEKLIFKLSNIK